MNFSTDNIVAFITSIVGVIFGYITCRLTLNKPQRLSILKEQLYEVYLPLFRKLEPNLYKSISTEDSKKYIDFFNSIKSNKYELIDSELCNLFWIFENSYNSGKVDLNTYLSICARLDTVFESTRRKLHMPTRNFAYKCNRRQFPRRFIDFCKYILKHIYILCIFLILCFIFTFLVQCIYNISNLILNIIVH